MANHRMRIGWLLGAWALGAAADQTITNGITTVTPASASQGQTGVVVAFQLNAASLPPPPGTNVMPNQARIGALVGTGLTRSGQVVTATFSFPAAETTGLRNAEIRFPAPTQSLYFIKLNGFTVLSTSAPPIVRVDVDNLAGPWNGTTWTTAYRTVQEGWDAAAAGQGEVWVAAGTYTPGSNGARTNTFHPRSLVTLYGGFAGGETNRSQRDPAANLTVLSGDVGLPGIATDNCYHVIQHGDAGLTGVRLDGFTVRDGRADGHQLDGKGGGFYCDNGGAPTFVNCRFLDLYGGEGGAGYTFGQSAPVFLDCVFSNNAAKRGGALALRYGGVAVLSNCVFTHNAADWRGGALYCEYGASPRVTRCVFSNNASGGNGGAIFTDDLASQVGIAAPALLDCTVVNNTAGYRGGGLHNFNGARPGVTNTHFAGNSAGIGGGAIANDLNVRLILNNVTYGSNTSASGLANLDSDASSTVTVLSNAPGYNLFAPLNSTNTYLMDNAGRTVFTWRCAYTPGQACYLLTNGLLFRTGRYQATTNFGNTGGMGGIVQLIDTAQVVRWEYICSSSNVQQHHDALLLPNGNALLVAWQRKSYAEAEAAGRNPALLGAGELWADSLLEVRTNDNAIVWEWHLWDHLVQDFDNTKLNFGVVSNHPELVDVNFGGTALNADWTHINAVSYIPERDQLLVSVHNLHEIWVLDHSTTSAEAAGHAGGASGRGGDLLYRWGNPRAYDTGTTNSQRLFSQHNITSIPAGYPGAGRFLVFNNGGGRPGGNFSSVDEFIPPLTPAGLYSNTLGVAYAPTGSVWRYTDATPTNFYAANISGAQRLPDGNTLICDGPAGRFFEVNGHGDTVWSYDYAGQVFRVTRYPTNYPGLPAL
jgi:predicted outer membrane repeat protein